jgi:hypothetical protein
MSRRIGLLVSLVCLFIAVPLMAGESSHYVNGVEGIKAASLPPPGVYGRLYTVYYGADSMNDANGHDMNVGLDLNVVALVPRCIWITPMTILGASYGCDVIAPILHTDLSIDAMSLKDKHTGLGDICVEPLILSWHLPRADASAAFGVYCPTGNFEPTEPASPGMGFWTYMFTLGGTCYLDADRTCAASVLSRYEINSKKEHVDVRPGDSFHFEWGLSKNIGKTLDLGVAGYCLWQITNDEGSDLTGSPSDRDRVFAAGPEVSYFIGAAKTFVSLRYLEEFDARDRTEGDIAALTLTKIF